MKRTMFVLLLILCGSAAAEADTYQWTDDKGVINFSDNLSSIPAKYRSRAKKREDITTRNPKVRQEVDEQERRARDEERNAPRRLENLNPSQPGGPINVR